MKKIPATYPLNFRFNMDPALVGPLASEPSDDRPEESVDNGERESEHTIIATAPTNKGFCTALLTLPRGYGLTSFQSNHHVPC